MSNKFRNLPRDVSGARESTNLNRPGSCVTKPCGRRRVCGLLEEAVIETSREWPRVEEDKTDGSVV